MSEVKPGLTDENETKYCSVNDKYFVNKSVTHLFKCIKCNNIPYPCFTILNQNEFICNKCIKLNNNKINVQKENGLNAVIGKAIIYCLNNNINNNNNEGNIIETKHSDNNICEWTGSLKSFNEHNNECLLSLILCKYCNNINNKILRKNINNHYNICNEYPIKCQNNGCNKIMKRKNMNNHIKNECEYELITCKNIGCNVVMIKKESIKHINECLKRVVDCPYTKYGCNISIIYDQTSIHMETYALKHCEYLENSLNTANQKIVKLQNHIDQKDGIIEEKNIELESTKAKYLNIIKKQDDCKSKMELNDNELKTLRMRLKELESMHIKYGFKVLELKNKERMELKSNIINEYYNITLNDESILTTNEYNNDTKNGGLLILNVKNNLVLNDNSFIHLNGCGYKGGNPCKQGHSYQGNSMKLRKNNYGGGGTNKSEYYYSGAGGGYGTKGESIGDALGGECYGNNKLDILYLGSGGGGSNKYKGGNGGGSIKIECNKLIINKNCGIYCNGNYGNGFSGSGSGGSIYIICNELINYGNIHAKGRWHAGYGRIRIDCNKITNEGSILPKIGYNKYKNWF